MAKETKAERMVRESYEHARALECARETYLSRVMALLERAQKVNFDLTINQDMFVLHDRDAYYSEMMSISPIFDEESENYHSNFQIAIRAVESKEDLVKEQNRKHDIRKAARAKLTDEEIELLGISTW